MYINPKVTRTAADSLSEIVFAYWLQDNLTLKLDGISHYNRPSTRHKFRLEKKWSRLMDRENSMPRYEPPQDVKDEILKQVRDAVKFEII